MPEYNEEAFLKASEEIEDAVYGMLQAGASEDDIQHAVKNAIRNAS